MKAGYDILLSRAEAIGGLNMRFDSVKEHRPTEMVFAPKCVAAVVVPSDGFGWLPSGRPPPDPLRRRLTLTSAAVASSL